MTRAALFRPDPATASWKSTTIPAAFLQPSPDFTYGVTKPSASNSGLLAGPTPVTDASGFTVVNTKVTYDSSYSNQVIRFTKFTRKPSVNGAVNLTFEYCILEIPGSDGQSLNCIGTNSSTVGNQNLILRYCIIQPPTPYSSLNYSVFGRGYTLDRCDVSRCVDLASIVGLTTANVDLNVVIKGCYFHEQIYYVPDPVQADNNTHSDGIQVHYGGNNIDIFGNTFAGTCYIAGSSSGAPTYSSGVVQSGNIYYPNDPIPISWVQFSPQSAAAGISNVKFRSNWATGGLAGFNFPRTDGTAISITDNRWGTTFNGTFGGLSYDGRFYMLIKSAQAVTVTGNTLESDGTSYNTRKAG